MSDTQIPTRTGLSDDQFKRLASFIEGEIGIRMPDTKRIMLESRLQKRLRTLKMSTFEEYLEHVFSDHQRESELVHMIDAVTTNKTDFFREADHFDFVLHQALPRRYAEAGWGRSRRNPLRAWSTACSSGEEIYTLAMTFEEFKAQHSDFEYVILGTDLSSAMLERARSAIYPEERIEPVPDAYRRKYLLRSKDRSKNTVRVKAELRNRVRLHRLNLMSDDFGIRNQFEIIFCRNVIIYFDRPNQSKLLHHLYQYLVPGGYLLLGHSETLAGLELPLHSVAPTVYQKPE